MGGEGAQPWTPRDAGRGRVHGARGRDRKDVGLAGRLLREAFARWLLRPGVRRARPRCGRLPLMLSYFERCDFPLRSYKLIKFCSKFTWGCAFINIMWPVGR